MVSDPFSNSTSHGVQVHLLAAFVGTAQNETGAAPSSVRRLQRIDKKLSGTLV